MTFRPIRIEKSRKASASRSKTGEADAILRKAFDQCGLNEKVWQHFIAVPDIKSVGTIAWK